MSKRAANGTGSIRKRADGRWEGRYTAPDGRQRSVYAATDKAVKKALKAAQAEMTLGIWFEPSKVTVEKWVRVWLRDYVSQNKPTTQKSYASLMEHHIIPHIGRAKLHTLNVGTMRRLFAQLSATLAPSTVKAVKIAFSSCMTAAIENKLVKENPCHGAKIKKLPKKQLVFVDRKDFPAFIAEAKKRRFSTAILLMFQTGLRSSEMRGLRWSDFDEGEGKIHVGRQIIESAGTAIVQAPKDDEWREITLTQEMVAILKRHRAQQAELRLKYAWQDTPITKDLIFRAKDGGIYQQSKLYYTVTQIGKAIGIDGLHPHSLRDSYAIAALRAGVDIKTISNNLGHADASMTLNKYMEYTDDMGRVAAEKYAQYLSENGAN
jgi:integrase